MSDNAKDMAESLADNDKRRLEWLRNDKEMQFCKHDWDRGECRKCKKFAENLVAEHEKKIEQLDIAHDIMASKIVRKTNKIFSQRQEIVILKESLENFRRSPINK